MKGEWLKRITAMVVCSLMVVGATACVSSNNTNNVNKQPVGNGGLPALDSWHEEKSGYTFCGYYTDEDFTSPVMQTVTQAQASKYYPKYQLDKVQQIACAPTDYEQVIYALDFESAISIYHGDTYAIYDNTVAGHQLDYSSYGIPYTRMEIYTNDVTEKLYTMEDTSETIPYDYRNIMIPHYMKYGRQVYNYEMGQYEQKLYTRNNTWRAYISSDLEDATSLEQVVHDGWVYDIIDNSFAVIYGFASEMVTGNGNEAAVDSLTVPAKIGKYPVKEISILNGLRDELYFPEQIGTLTIPSSVENVVLYGLYTANQIENLVLEEGIKTLRMESHAAKSVSLPKSLYYADFNALQNNYMKDNCYNEQSISVAENGHYYTKDGCLYSKEGDLVFQFASRDKIDLKIDETAKRVLPLSLVGGCKNIYIPEGMEYFDWFAFLYGARSSWMINDSAKLSSDQPMLLIESPKVAECMLKDTIYDAGYERFMPILFSKKIGKDAIVSSVWAEIETFFREKYEQSSETDGSLAWEEMSEQLKNQILSSFIDHLDEEYNGEVLTANVVSGYEVCVLINDGQLCIEVDNVVYRQCNYDFITGAYSVIAYSYVNSDANTDYSQLEIYDPILQRYYDNGN